MAPNSASLTDGLFAKLEERICTGAMPPGSRFPTQLEISAAENVSRTVVREAVARLSAQGLTTSRQGSGVFVATTAQYRAFQVTRDRAYAAKVQGEHEAILDAIVRMDSTRARGGATSHAGKPQPPLAVERDDQPAPERGGKRRERLKSAFRLSYKWRDPDVKLRSSRVGERPECLVYADRAFDHPVPRNASSFDRHRSHDHRCRTPRRIVSLNALRAAVCRHRDQLCRPPDDRRAHAVAAGRSRPRRPHVPSYGAGEALRHLVLANDAAVISPPLRLNARLKRAPPSSSTPRVRSLPSLARRNVDFSAGKRLDVRHVEFVDVVLGYQAVRRDANL